MYFIFMSFFFSSRRRHTRWNCDWSSDVCSSDLTAARRAAWSGACAGPAVCLDLRLLPAACCRPPHGFRRDERRSEERRVGKECRSRWSTYHYNKKRMRYDVDKYDVSTSGYVRPL